MKERYGNVNLLDSTESVWSILRLIMDSRTPPTSLSIKSAHDQVGQSTLSPKTPSSAFGRTVIEESQSSVILAVVLSHWDNILGPRIRHLWHIRTLEEQVNAEILHYIASHTLSGEICRDPTDSNIDSKFYVLQDKQLIVTSFLFSAIDKGDLVVHSLSVIVHYKHLHIYLNWQQLTTSWMYRGVAKLRILLDKSPEIIALSKFGEFLTEFVSMFQSIKDAPVPRNIPITDTVFHHQVQLSSQLIHKAILCHLTTCGRSVVIGRTPGRINVVFIYILKACSTSVKQTVNSGTMEAPCSTEQNSMNKDIMLGSKVLN